ncbi:MAG: DUF1622 domain-containing protein [Candidatus Saccharimonadales bacterium]
MQDIAIGYSLFNFQDFAQNIGLFLDFVGIIVILAGAIIATFHAAVKFFSGHNYDGLYNDYRWNLARSILIGLEFLVAGDIIRSVGGDLSLDSVLVLAIIVLVRAFLSIEFQMEIEGRWPWQMIRNKDRKDNKI